MTREISEQKKQMVSFRLSLELVKQLESAAQVSGLSQSKIMENALGHYFRGALSRELHAAAEHIAKMSKGASGTASTTEYRTDKRGGLVAVSEKESETAVSLMKKAASKAKSA